MRVVTAVGEAIELGTTETAPTIGIIDYSKRVTDDFGVTTVVERGFARRMSVRLGVPFDDVDGLQRRLADLRATSALWVADERFNSLSVRGFYKEFEIDLSVPPLSFCTLTVEGLVAADEMVDAGGDPAPTGYSSTLQLLQPVIMTNSVLATSTVIEDDYPEWSAGLSYPLGALVIKAATHRVYESAKAANVGNDPAGASGLWIDVGPTKRWAMFDQALGTAATATGSIEVTLTAGTVQAVALLDVVATAVRVRAPGYDRTIAVGAAAVTFLDLPSVTSPVTVTITGPNTVSVGTLLIGSLAALGVTEASPTAGITDYSRKDVDDFGEVTIVQRAWAKRMTAKALIRTDAIDVVANRIAAVRARPSLWIGQSGVDSLTIYGFFKDFSIEAGEGVSKLSLSIEGLSAAAKIAPLGGLVDWPDIADPDGTKPSDNATNSADPASPLGPDDTVGEVLGFLAEARRNATEGLAQIAAANAALTATQQEIAQTVTAINAELATAREGLATTLALANSTASIARQTVQSALSGQLLEQRRKARVDALTHMDGVAVGVVVRQEITQRIEGEVATAGTFSLLGVKNSTGDAFILDSSTVLVSPDQSLGEKFSSIDAEFTRSDTVTTASIARLDTALATEVEARTTSITSLDTKFTNALGNAIGAVTADYREAVSNEAGARATAITTLQADFTTKIGAATTSITDLARTTSDADQALGERITQVNAAFQTALGTTNATIVTVQQAQASEVEARTTAITNLGATFTTALGNAITAVTNDYREAVSGEAGARATAITGLQANFTTKIAAANTSITDLARTTSDADQALGERITQVNASFQTALTASNTTIATIQQAQVDEVAARATAITTLGTSFDTKLGSAVGAVTTDYRQAVSNEAGARATAITDLGASFTNALGNAINATTSNFNQAIADETGARATQYGLVTARMDNVDGRGASVEQLFSAQADALGNLSARAGLAVTAGGVVSGIYVTAADGSNGKVSDITFDAMTINVGTATLNFNNGAIMEVMGTGFGVGNEFISWFGPSMPIAQCSRANGTIWKTVTGEGYYGASLSAGVLSASANSPSTADNVIADTGGFNSDGGKIVVVMSWSYSWEWRVNYDGTTGGRNAFDAAVAQYGATSSDGGYGWSGTRTETGSPTLTLSREIGGSALVDVASASINPGVGSVYGDRPLPGAGEGGYAVFSANWSASLTYTDPDRIVSDRRFTATLARFAGPYSGAIRQRVTIITTEE